MTDFSGGSWRSLITGDTVSAIPDIQLWHNSDRIDTLLSAGSAVQNDGDPIDAWLDSLPNDRQQYDVTGGGAVYRPSTFGTLDAVEWSGTDTLTRSQVVSAESFAIGAWVKPDSFGGMINSQYNVSAEAREWRLGSTSNDEWEFGATTDATDFDTLQTVTSTQDANTGEWRFIGGFYAAESTDNWTQYDIGLVIDGDVVGTHNLGSSIGDNNADFSVGGRTNVGGGLFSGLHHYSVMRVGGVYSPDEWTQLYNHRAGEIHSVDSVSQNIKTKI